MTSPEIIRIKSASSRKLVADLREAGLIVVPPAPLRSQLAQQRATARRARADMRNAKRCISGALMIAYQRRCFICRALGDCGHREPDVELALIEQRQGGRA